MSWRDRVIRQCTSLSIIMENANICLIILCCVWPVLQSICHLANTRMKVDNGRSHAPCTYFVCHADMLYSITKCTFGIFDYTSPWTRVRLCYTDGIVKLAEHTASYQSYTPLEHWFFHMAGLSNKKRLFIMALLNNWATSSNVSVRIIITHIFPEVICEILMKMKCCADCRSSLVDIDAMYKL